MPVQALQKWSLVVCLPLLFSSCSKPFAAASAPLCADSRVNAASSPMAHACWELGVCSALGCLLPGRRLRRPWVAAWLFLSLLPYLIHWGEGSLTAPLQRAKFLFKIFMAKLSFLRLSHSHLATYLHCSSTNITLSYPQFGLQASKAYMWKPKPEGITLPSLSPMSSYPVCSIPRPQFSFHFSLFSSLFFSLVKVRELL